MKRWSGLFLGVVAVGCSSNGSTGAGGSSTSTTSTGTSGVTTTSATSGSTSTGTASTTTSSGTTTSSTGTTSTTTSTGTGGFQVGNVQGLALWLDAGQGVSMTGNAVTKWLDQSANHNDGAPSNIANAFTEPQFVASSINGLPTLHFTPGTSGAGANIKIADSASLQWGTGDFVEVVGKYANNSPTGIQNSWEGTFYCRPATNGVWFKGNSIPSSTGLSALLSSGFGSHTNELITATTGFNNDMPRVMAMQRVGTTLSIRVNGAQTDQMTFGTIDLTAGGSTVWIGTNSGDISRLDGDIAEIIAVKGTIGAPDLMGIESYLKGKYGL